MSARAQWIADHILPHEPDLRAWLRRRMPRSFELDDIVQETYAVLAGLAEVSHITDPRGYFFTSAQSVVLQQVRRAQVVSFETVAELDKLDAARDDFDPERHAVAGDELRRIAALILALPEKCRQAFVLRKVHGLSQREISDRMGISENTVEKHICKGLRVLTEEMKHGAGPLRQGSVEAYAQRIEHNEQRGEY
ncbi:RNA polymerase sigma factor [Luteimonas sp. RIT-PG2_3]|jgi:RNA polymerase sigma-70 factor (ECF subfamily)